MSDLDARPTSRRREQTRARLFDAAHELFAEVGMDAASVEMIAERAGFSRGAFYSNFESKDELFLALIAKLADDQLSEVSERVEGLMQADIDTPDDVAELVRGIVGVSFSARLDPQLLSELRTQALRDPRFADAYLEWHWGVQARVQQIIEGVAGRFGLSLRISPADAAQLFLDTADNACAMATLEGRDGPAIDRAMNLRLEQLVRLLVEPA